MPRVQRTCTAFHGGTLIAICILNSVDDWLLFVYSSFIGFVTASYIYLYSLKITVHKRQLTITVSSAVRM